MVLDRTPRAGLDIDGLENHTFIRGRTFVGCDVVGSVRSDFLRSRFCELGVVCCCITLKSGREYFVAR